MKEQRLWLRKAAESRGLSREAVCFMSQSFKLPPFFLDHDFSYRAEDGQKQSFTKECQGSVQSDSMGIKIHC